jgi:hypothetical protein
MRNRPIPFLVAAALPIVVLLLAQWFDATQLQRLRAEEEQTFQAGPLFYGLAAAHILTPAAILAVALAGWWSRSAAIGAAYVVVGGLIAFSPALNWAFATGVNDTPIASVFSEIYFDTARGLTAAVTTIGGAMFLVGLVLIAQRLRGRRGRAAMVMRAA